MKLFKAKTAVVIGIYQRTRTKFFFFSEEKVVRRSKKKTHEERRAARSALRPTTTIYLGPPIQVDTMDHLSPVSTMVLPVKLNIV